MWKVTVLWKITEGIFHYFKTCFNLILAITRSHFHGRTSILRSCVLLIRTSTSKAICHEFISSDEVQHMFLDFKIVNWISAKTFRFDQEKRTKRWTRGVAKGVTMAKIHKTRRGKGCRVDKMRRRENSEGVREGDSRRIIKWKKRSRMFFWQREKEGKQRWEEEKDSCPTTT